MTHKHKFPYKWTLADAPFTKDKGKVFSCFACGGGSSMGYKLAGYDVVGCNEIDPRINAIYVDNLHPKHNYVMDIRELVAKAKAHELPDELYHLDVLDGSPPCSTFSMSGSREAAWGKEKYFREGQEKQVLDTLFFDFIELAKTLKPKVVIAENVKGIILGKAKRYTAKILHDLDYAGYYVTHKLLNASTMGVPQRRERVFFLAIRKDLGGKFLVREQLFHPTLKINLDFKEEPILFGEIQDGKGKPINPMTKTYELWSHAEPEDANFGDVYERLWGKHTMFNCVLFHPDKVAPTIAADTHNALILKDYPRFLGRDELIKCSTFPLDYHTEKDKDLGFMVGMSVPPIMMAQVASRVYEQWLSKI